MQRAAVQRCPKGNSLGASLDTGLQPVPRSHCGATLSGCKVWSSHPRCLRQKKRLSLVSHGVREDNTTFSFTGQAKHPSRKAQVTATGEETSNGYVSSEVRHNVLNQSNGGNRPGGPGSSSGEVEVEGAQKAASRGTAGDLTAEQKAALQALDAQLNTLSDSDPKAGQLSARRKFAEDLARKSGRAVPSESPPSKRTLAGDYLDSAAWDQKVAADKGFELDDSFLAYTGAALLVLTVVTNLFLNKFFPLPTKAQVKEMRRKDEAMMSRGRFDTQDTDLSSAPPLRDS